MCVCVCACEETYIFTLHVRYCCFNTLNTLTSVLCQSTGSYEGECPVDGRLCTRYPGHLDAGEEER